MNDRVSSNQWGRDKVQREGDVIHLIGEQLRDLSDNLQRESDLDEALPLSPG
jgi:hypothetical protein